MIFFHGYHFSPPLVSLIEIVCTVPVRSPCERDITTLVNKGLFTAMETSFPLPPRKTLFSPFHDTNVFKHHTPLLLFCFFAFYCHHCSFYLFSPSFLFSSNFFSFFSLPFSQFPPNHTGREFSPHREGIFPLYTPLFIKRIPLWQNC
jgi:hypothetical protein